MKNCELMDYAEVIFKKRTGVDKLLSPGKPAHFVIMQFYKLYTSKTLSYRVHLTRSACTLQCECAYYASWQQYVCRYYMHVVCE